LLEQTCIDVLSDTEKSQREVKKSLSFLFFNVKDARKLTRKKEVWLQTLKKLW